MDDNQIHTIIENEKEWRKHLVVKLDDISEVTGKQEVRISKLEVVQKWIWSVIGVSILGTLVVITRTLIIGGL